MAFSIVMVSSCRFTTYHSTYQPAREPIHLSGNFEAALPGMEHPTQSVGLLMRRGLGLHSSDPTRPSFQFSKGMLMSQEKSLGSNGPSKS